MSPQSYLRLIKVAHTIAWAFLAGCVLAIPYFAWLGQFQTTALLIGIVFAEVLILLLNHWHCPLTGVAARYTDQRQDNFDIYLPLWLARNNKLIFGSLFLSGLLYTLVRWLNWMG